jgi:hypothetical protein
LALCFERQLKPETPRRDRDQEEKKDFDRDPIWPLRCFANLPIDERADSISEEIFNKHKAQDEQYDKYDSQQIEIAIDK